MKKMSTLKVQAQGYKSIKFTRSGTLKKENLIYQQFFQDANRLKSI